MIVRRIGHQESLCENMDSFSGSFQKSAKNFTRNQGTYDATSRITIDQYVGSTTSRRHEISEL